MFGIEVHAAYGMTETVTHATYGRPAEQLPERSMGHVSPGYEFAVVDKDTGELCAEGETGELWLQGHPRHPAVPRVPRQPRGQREGVRRRLVQDR